VSRRTATKIVSASIAVLSLIWTIWLTTVGGFETEILGIPIKSNEPLRALAVSLLAWVGFFAAGGRIPESPARHFTNHFLIAGFLAAGTFALGVSYATTTIGGSDSYGYASEAELLIERDLTVEQPWVKHVPWPNAGLTFTPLGYTARRHGDGSEIVPMYPPGLPMLMAAAKLIGGQEALFWIVPLAGALLVLATYGIGATLASREAGLIGALFVATSPVTLFSLMTPMSDVPAAAAWGLALCWVLQSRDRTALLGGLAAGVAVLIRPNLAACVALLPLRYLLARDASTPISRSLRQSAYFLAGLVPPVMLLMLVNSNLYGFALELGYGQASGYFSPGNFWRNARTYLQFLLEIHSPFVLAGVAALIFPLRIVWPSAERRSLFVVITGSVAVLWAVYCLFVPFEAWWYLRFFLPAWPILMVSMAAVLMAGIRFLPSPLKMAAVVCAVWAGLYELRLSADRGVFDMWHQDRAHYVAPARLVGSMTDEKSVILSMQHSGSLRYYAGRMTLRWDILDSAWLDRAVQWFSERGVSVYMMVDDWEQKDVLSKFTTQSAAGLLKQPPLFIVRGVTSVYLYDLRPDSQNRQTLETHEANHDLRSAAPAKMPDDQFQALK
jgi:hypothetical protein